MAITNSERVGKALDVLKEGLHSFVERELKASYKTRWLDTAKPSFPDWQQPGKNGEGLKWDAITLVRSSPVVLRIGTIGIKPPSPKRPPRQYRPILDY